MKTQALGQRSSLLRFVGLNVDLTGSQLSYNVPPGSWAPSVMLM